MKQYCLMAIAAANFGTALAQQNLTVAEALRTIQQGLNEARVEKVNLVAGVTDKIKSLINSIQDANRVSIEKMQKGKNDAWDLIYDPVLLPEEGDLVQSTEETIPEVTPSDIDCIVWEGNNYTGKSKTLSHPIPESNDWYNHVFEEPIILGSWKCGPNVRVWWQNQQVTDQIYNAKPVSGTRGIVANPVGPNIEITWGATRALYEPNGNRSGNVFTQDGCQGPSTFLWTQKERDDRTRWMNSDYWQFFTVSQWGEIRSAAIPDGISATFYQNPGYSGSSITIEGYTDSDGWPACFSVVPEGSQGAYSAAFKYLE